MSLVLLVIAALLGFAVGVFAVRGVARWCPTCGSRLTCKPCDSPASATTLLGSRWVEEEPKWGR